MGGGHAGTAPIGSEGFLRLHRRARQIERYILLLVALVALAPPTVFTVRELSRLNGATVHHARHSAHFAMVQALSGFDVEAVRANLENERREHGLAFVRFLDTSGAEVVGAGEVSSSLVMPTVRLGLPPLPGGLREVEARVSGHNLLEETLGVFAIHIVVGLGLGFLVYRIPVRALDAAIQELETAQVQLLHAHKLAALGEIYAGLTHEVNNPLGIVLARVRLLLSAAREKGLDPETVQDLEVVERHGSRIGQIVRALLAFARKTEMEARETDLNAVVRNVVGLVDKAFAKDGIRIETRLAPGLPRITGSPDHLQQVFLNLFTNARDAMPKGGSILVGTAAAKGTVTAEVRDTGPGLAPAVQERVFEPFFTTKEVGKGTGLGLSVSYGIVKAHGGELEARNAPDGGASFLLTLPAAAPSAS